MAETPVGALRRQVSAELPPPGFFANEAEAQAFDAFQQAFGFFLDDAYAEHAMHELGVWEPSGTWYSGLNVKELDAYIGSVAKHLSETETPHITKQRVLDLLKAIQHYKETVGITASDDTHTPKTDSPADGE